jgi:hypothetical protein
MPIFLRTSGVNKEKTQQFMSIFMDFNEKKIIIIFLTKGFGKRIY